MLQNAVSGGIFLLLYWAWTALKRTCSNLPSLHFYTFPPSPAPYSLKVKTDHNARVLWPWHPTRWSHRLLPEVLIHLSQFCRWSHFSSEVRLLQGCQLMGTHKLGAERECQSSCAGSPLTLISPSREAQIPWRELYWTWKVWFGPIRKALCLPNPCVEARRMITFPGGVKSKIAEVVLVHLNPAPELDRWFGEMKC